MHRLLPPLVVLAALVLVAVRCGLEPARAQQQGQIDGLIQGGDFSRADARLTSYLERYDEIEDRWFACRILFRMHRPGEAIDLIWGNEAMRENPATGRRFAETALRALGWHDQLREEATPLEPRILTTLVEGGDAWATARLTDHAATMEMRASTLYFFPAYRRATRRPMDVIVAAYRTRDEEKYHVAAALGAVFPPEYPEKDKDVAVLRKVLASSSWRRNWRDVWTVAALSLGRSDRPGALETLKSVQANLEGSARERDKTDLLLMRTGLLAAGDWSADTSLAAATFGTDPDLMVASWYLEALIHRYRVGDMRCERRLVQFWSQLGVAVPDLRARMARAFLLQDVPPSEDAKKQWVDRMVAELEQPDASVMAHVLARSYRLRNGVPGARAGIVTALRAAGKAFEQDPAKVAELTQPFVEALRALYLYDR